MSDKLQYLHTYQQKTETLIKIVLNAEAMTLSPRSKIFVLVVLTSFLNNRDFFFQLLTQSYFTLFLHLIDHTIGSVLVRNKSQYAVHLSHKQTFELVTKVFYKNCFQADLDLNAAEILSKANPLYKSCQKIKVSAMDLLLKTKLPNSI